MSMNIKELAAKAAFALKDKAPEILVGAGILSIGAGVFFACKATVKVSKIKDEVKEEINSSVNEAKETLSDIDKVVDGEIPVKEGEEYTLTDAQKDKGIVYGKTFGSVVKSGFKVAKEYAPAAGFLVTGIALVLFSHKILRDRNAALLTAYTALDSAFKVYRQRVIDKGGKELDAEFLYGTKTEITEKKVKNPETGLEETVIETEEVPNYPLGSPYARIFDSANSVIYEDADSTNDYNRMRLQQAEAWVNQRLKAKGYIFLNEVYIHLGLEPSQEGQFVGWIYNSERGDNYIDFGIDLSYTDPRFKDYIEDYGVRKRRKIVLDFNVDGVIYDKIFKNSRMNNLDGEQLAEIAIMTDKAEEGRAEHNSEYARMDEEAYAMQNK